MTLSACTAAAMILPDLSLAAPNTVGGHIGYGSDHLLDAIEGRVILSEVSQIYLTPDEHRFHVELRLPHPSVASVTPPVDGGARRMEFDMAVDYLVSQDTIRVLEPASFRAAREANGNLALRKWDEAVTAYEAERQRACMRQQPAIA
jgi:hypothetical protein